MQRKLVLLGLHILWWLVLIMACSVFAVSKWEGYALLQSSCGDVLHCENSFGLTDSAIDDLLQNGLSASFYSGLLIVFMSIANMSYLVVGALLYRFRNRDTFSMASSLFLIIIGTIFCTDEQALMDYPLLLQWFHILDDAGSFYLPFLFLFPDGRFAPRWSVAPAIVWVAVQTFRLLNPAMWEQLNWDPSFMIALLIATHGPLLYALVYRYRRAESAIERRHLNWFLLSVCSYVAGGVLLAVQYVMQEGLLQLIFLAAFFAGLLFWPFSIGIAVLERNRNPASAQLNRAFLVSTFSFITVLLYAASVGSLNLLLRQEEVLVSLISSGVIAILFHPLYVRLRRGINRLVYGDPQTPYEIMNRLIDRMETAAQRQPLWKEVAEVFAKATDGNYAAIELRDGSTLAEYGQPTKFVNELDLQWDGEYLGVVRLGARQRKPVAEYDMEGLILPLIRQVSMAVYAARLEEDLRQSRERLVATIEEERRRLGRDLHDGIGASLAIILLKVDTISDQNEGNTRLFGQLADVEESIEEAVTEVRRLAYSLRPPVLDEFGLLFAIRELAIGYDGSVVHIEVDAPDQLPALSAAAELAVYRIVQEAVTNTIRHSSAGYCRIALSGHGDGLELTVEDNGQGMPKPYVPGVGIRSMRERAEEIGGQWEMRESAEGGALIYVFIPRSVVEGGDRIA